MDHIFTINQVLEKSREFNFPLHIMFIDYNKAFDSVKHSAVWKVLENQGIGREMKVYIKLDREGEMFEVQKGVKQGDLLSPHLFNAVLEEVLKKLEWEGRRIRINGLC